MDFYEDAFTELILLGQKTWNDDEVKKRRFVQNARSIGLIDTVFEDLVSDESFIEMCNFLKSHTIRHDQQNKEKAARQIHNIKQPPSAAKRDKVTKVLAFVNELQIQDSGGSDEEVDDVPTSKTAMVCKLAQIPQDIWMNLSIDAKIWLLNERKRQQQEDDKRKKVIIEC
jgi:hypothetical protein